MVIGPWGLRLVSNVENIMSFAEFGIVLLLSLIWGSFVPSIYYGFQGRADLVALYWSMVRPCAHPRPS